MQLPKFAQRLFAGRIICVHCDGAVHRDDLDMIGFSGPDDQGVVTPRLNVRCRSCGESMLINLERMQIDRFLADLRNALMPSAPPRPSIRPGTPATPITDAEVVIAKRELERLSLRRGSVSWSKFLRRLGGESL